MTKYKVIIQTQTLTEVDALNEENAKEKIRKQLIESGQIKPAEPINIIVCENKNE